MLNVLLMLTFFVLLLGVLGEKDKSRQTNITIAFVAVVLLLLFVNR